jgi:uncharacterized membrane protein
LTSWSKKAKIYLRCLKSDKLELYDFVMEALKIILIAMSPIAELRAAIPLGVIEFGQPWYLVFILSLLGNMIPVFFLLWALPRLSVLLSSSRNPVGRFLNWRAERLRTTQGSRFRKYGAFILVPLVAVPLPFTGAWTGCIAAWAFDIPPKKALPLIALGVLIAGIIVTALTVGGINVTHWF